MRILEISAHYPPNIGGVETHLSDLVNILVKHGNKVFVLAYRPLTTNIGWNIFEKNKNLEILRIPWISGLYYKFVKYPVLEFIYLIPGLFILTPFIILLKSVDVINAHGLVAGSAALFWGKVFKKRVVIATHSIYHFPKAGLYRRFAKYILSEVDTVLCLSKQSALEIIQLGISKANVKVFTYWVDLKKFSMVENAKRKLNWEDKFIVLFVGRLIVEKGILELIKASKKWNKNITLIIVGAGPLEKVVRKISKEDKKIEYVGFLSQDQLPLYYSAADLTVVPSIHQEGFGRVILESLACGTPVIASKGGAISEAMDESVGKLIKITSESIARAVDDLYKHKSALNNLSKKTRKYAEKKYSEKNTGAILEYLNESTT